MSFRRKSRELAMQALFYMDMEKSFSLGMFAKYTGSFVDSQDADQENVIPFSERLVSGVIEKKDEIDTLLVEFSNNWKLSRMSGVDRNAMRIAVYEMLFCKDIPLKVSINEAIDIGKKYGARDSGGFINGILDTIRDHLEKKGPSKKGV